MDANGLIPILISLIDAICKVVLKKLTILLGITVLHSVLLTF